MVGNNSTTDLRMSGSVEVSKIHCMADVVESDGIDDNVVELVVVEMDVAEAEEREADAVDFWEPALPLK